MVSWALPSLSSNRKPAAKKKLAKSSTRSVTFDFSKNTVQEMYHVNDLSVTDIETIWVSAEDLLATKKDYTAVVRRMMRSREPLEETEDFCCRGLGKLVL
jgi:hypothetical protein